MNEPATADYEPDRGTWLGVVDRQAVYDSAPLLIGAIPFALVVGLAATEAAMPAWIGWLTSPLVFAGAAQLTFLSLAGSASAAAVLLAVAIVNARHVMYSAALSPEFARHPAWFRWFGASLLIDQNFATASTMVGVPDAARFRRYYLTSSLFLYFNWVWLSALGMFVGPALPDSLRLEFTIPILFVGIAVAAIKRGSQAVAAVVGGTVGLAASGLPDRVGIIIGAICGVIAGIVAGRLLDDTERHRGARAG